MGLILGYYAALLGGAPAILPDFDFNPALGVVTTGELVESLTDQASGFVGTPKTAAMRPTLTTVSGYPALQFFGAQGLDFGDVMALPFGIRTTFVVGAITSGTNGTFYAKCVSGAHTGRYGMVKEGDGMASFFHRNGVQSYASFTHTVQPGVFTQQIQTAASSPHRFHRDGQAVVVTSGGTTGNAAGRFGVGFLPNDTVGTPLGGYSMNGYILRIISFSKVLTLEEIAAKEIELQATYANLLTP